MRSPDNKAVVASWGYVEEDRLWGNRYHSILISLASIQSRLEILEKAPVNL